LDSSWPFICSVRPCKVRSAGHGVALRTFFYCPSWLYLKSSRVHTGTLRTKYFIRKRTPHTGTLRHVTRNEITCIFSIFVSFFLTGPSSFPLRNTALEQYLFPLASFVEQGNTLLKPSLLRYEETPSAISEVSSSKDKIK
jgi:hypothetical protein